MNRKIRVVATALIVIMIVLLGNATLVQVVRADKLRDNPNNSRILIDNYKRERGSIVVDGHSIAKSVATDDELKYLRVYTNGTSPTPNGEMYASVTGYFSLIYGAAALERTENSLLSGADDRLFGRSLSDLLTGQDPKGATVELTLDGATQAAAYNALKGKAGAVVAINPQTGALLALASTPSYDPNLLTSHNSQAITKNWNTLQNDPGTPLINRADQQLYPPGSTFKIVVAAAAIADGYTPTTEVDAPRTYRLPGTSTSMHNFGNEPCGSGRVTLQYAFQHSCNTAFAILGVKLGQDKISAMAKAFGFDSSFTMPLPVVASKYPNNLNDSQVALSSIGQYDDLMTPMQGVLLAAAVADQGTIMKPYLIDRVRGPDLSTIDETSPKEMNNPLTPAQAAMLNQMMIAVVNGGSGTSAKIAGIQVAGKTGTAEHGTGRPPHAWFVGFAPADDPTIAVAVLIENGGDEGDEATGGSVAAPIARTVLQAYLKK